MAYTTPPTFTDGDYLTASNLNILSDDVEYLHGRINQPNPGFVKRTLTAGDGATATESGYSILHLTNTFRYRITLAAGTADQITIKYNGSTIYTDGTDRNATYEWSGTVDITSLGLTVGEWYGLSVVLEGEPGSGTNTIEIWYLGEDW